MTLKNVKIKSKRKKPVKKQPQKIITVGKLKYQSPSQKINIKIGGQGATAQPEPIANYYKIRGSYGFSDVQPQPIKFSSLESVVKPIEQPLKKPELKNEVEEKSKPIFIPLKPEIKDVEVIKQPEPLLRPPVINMVEKKSIDIQTEPELNSKKKIEFGTQTERIKRNSSSQTGEFKQEHKEIFTDEVIKPIEQPLRKPVLNLVNQDDEKKSTKAPPFVNTSPAILAAAAEVMEEEKKAAAEVMEEEKKAAAAAAPYVETKSKQGPGRPKGSSNKSKP
jgi:hypothetical protein